MKSTGGLKLFMASCGFLPWLQAAAAEPLPRAAPSLLLVAMLAALTGAAHADERLDAPVDAPTTELRGPGPVAIYLEQCQRPEDLRPGLCIVAEAQDGAERPADVALKRRIVRDLEAVGTDARRRLVGARAFARRVVVVLVLVLLASDGA